MIDWPNSETGCYVLMGLCGILVITSISLIPSSLDSGWVTNENMAEEPRLVVDYVEYNDLPADQREEFDQMVNGGSIEEESIALADNEEFEDGEVIGVEYEGEEYIIQYATQLEVDSWFQFILSASGVILGVVLFAHSWVRRSSIALEQLRENPVEYIENR